ncbi:MAG TPA: helix-turn-helix domain-containing protein [Pseudonocardiaceae bacterium]|nr:helix-turn-helix domain-containing protein [Pseudonocardiaceae bacterium]
MAVAAPLTLRPGDRPRLEALIRATSVRAGLAQRARMVLLAADGLANAEIARLTGSTRPTVLAWRNRYATGGLSGLRDRPRSGRPAKVDEIQVVAVTLADDGRPPAHLGVPYWSSRLLARELGLSFTTVARIWRKWGIQPRRVEAFRFSIGPELGAPELDAGSPGPGRGPGGPAPVRPHRGSELNVGRWPGDRATAHPDPWLNLVDVSLDILTRQAIRRGTFASVHHLIEALGALTDGWSDRVEPVTHSGGTALVTTDRKTTLGTRRPGERSKVAEVDLLRIPDRPPGGPRNPMSLRAEFHGTRCGAGRRLDPPSG